MDSINALVLLVSMYVGGVTGSQITAILFSIPGTPASIVTTFDGFQMAKQGKPQQALAFGVMASFVGGLISWLFLAVISQPLARLALKFSPFDYFALVMMALVLMASISQGSLIKGLLSGFLGILVALPGLDPSSAQLRLDFGFNQMAGGFSLLPVLIGVFALGTILPEIIKAGRAQKIVHQKIGLITIAFNDFKDQYLNLIRSSIVGTWIGILPGIGASVASMVSYTIAKSFSKKPEKYGRGIKDGIIASEAANNASIGGALIPLVAMGIPGSVVDAILLAALLLHGLQPGPLLFSTSPEMAWSIIATAFVANLVMLLIMVTCAGFVARLVKIPKHYLFPVIITFCVLGTYAVNNRIFDVWVMVGFGIVGCLMSFGNVPRGPFIIGFILAPVAETRLRSGLMASQGSLLPLVTKPLTVCLLLISLFFLVWPFYQQWKTRNKKV
jgi:putative tricarboxylic transport membrane protein